MFKAFRVCRRILAVIQSKWKDFYFFPVISIWNHKINNMVIYKHITYTYIHILYIHMYIYIQISIYNIKYVYKMQKPM